MTTLIANGTSVHLKSPVLRTWNAGHDKLCWQYHVPPMQVSLTFARWPFHNGAAGFVLHDWGTTSTRFVGKLSFSNYRGSEDGENGSTEEWSIKSWTSKESPIKTRSFFAEGEGMRTKQRKTQAVQENNRLLPFIRSRPCMVQNISTPRTIDATFVTYNRCNFCSCWTVLFWILLRLLCQVVFKRTPTLWRQTRVICGVKTKTQTRMTYESALLIHLLR